MRTSCPKCKTKFVATVYLKEQDWMTHDYTSCQPSQAKFSRKKAIKMYLEGGMSIAAIAQRFGVTAPSVREALKKSGVVR